MKSKYNAHTDPIFMSMNILKLSDLYKLHLFKFFYKYVNKKLPEYFSSSEIVEFARNINVRNNRLLQVPRRRHTFANHCIRYNLPVEINKLNNSIQRKVYTHSLNGFSLICKQSLVSNYQLICVLPNCFICQHR